MQRDIIQLVSALCGTFGFSLMYNHKGANIILCSFGGCISWGVCMLTSSFTENLFFIYITAAFIGAMYSEIMARLRKVPATAFMFPSIITLVPGSGLYNSLLFLMRNDADKAKFYGTNTVLTVCGIAVGIVIISVIFKIISDYKQTHRAS